MMKDPPIENVKVKSENQMGKNNLSHLSNLKKIRQAYFELRSFKSKIPILNHLP